MQRDKLKRLQDPLFQRRIQSPPSYEQSLLQDYCFNLPESLARLATSSGKDLKNVAAVFVPTACFDSLVAYPEDFSNSDWFSVGRLSVFLPTRLQTSQK